MLIFHLDIDRVDYTTIGQRYTIWILKDNVPTTLITVIRNVALVDVVENALMKIAYVVIVGLITLTENLAVDDLLPT